MKKEGKKVRIVVEATEDVQYLLRNLAAKRGQKIKDTLRELIEQAAKDSGIEPMRGDERDQ